MAKINEAMYNNATQKAGLKDNQDKKLDSDDMQRYIAVYDIPKKWIQAVKEKSGIRTMSTFARQAILEKLMRDGLL